jgi:hypothetical protein
MHLVSFKTLQEFYSFVFDYILEVTQRQTIMVSMHHLREEHVIANLLKNLKIFVFFSKSGVFVLILQLYLGNYLVLKIENDRV